MVHHFSVSSDGGFIPVLVVRRQRHLHLDTRKGWTVCNFSEKKGEGALVNARVMTG